MEKYLQEKEFAYPCKHRSFSAMSHAMFAEIGIICRLAFKTERHNKIKCAEERRQLQNELVNWVEKVW